MASATDDFTRADSATLGSNWTQAKGHGGTPGVLSNQAYDPNGDGTRTGAYYSATSFGNDQFSQATVINVATFYQAVTVRGITSGTLRNYYAGGHANNDTGHKKYTIWKEVASVISILANHASEVVTANDVLYLEVSGTTLTLKANGVTKVTTTDSDLSSGQPGLRDDHNVGSTAMFDDWSGGDLSAGITYPQLERDRRGIARGVLTGA